jgi:glutathione S-transferase
MPSLLHHPLDPSSRLIRLMCAEYGVPLDMEEIKPWLRTAELLEINPAATLPIFLGEDDQPIVGLLANIHTIEDLYTPSVVTGLIPAEPGSRAEMWRMIEWVIGKLNDEVTRYVLEEKIVKRDQKGATPDPAVLQLALRQPLLAGRRHADPGRFRAGSASVDTRLSGRYRLGQGRGNPRLVFPHQVPPGLPNPAQ